MTTPSLNYFYRVKLTAVEYTLGGVKDERLNVRALNSQEFNFVNKPLVDASTASDRETYLPILQQIGEITLSAGDVTPSTSLSSITIDNTRGSIGYNRRFSDVLDRYTIIDQPIEFYIGVSSTDVDNPTSWQRIGTGIVQEWDMAISSEEPTLSISISPFKLSDKIMNLQVSRDIVGMENAPEQALSKFLPILFCKTQPNSTAPLSYPEVLPTRISNDGATTAKYALTSQMYEVTKAKFSSYIYAKKSTDEDDVAWTFIKIDRATDDYLADTTDYIGLSTYSSIAWRLPSITPVADETGFLVTGTKLRAKGNGTALRVSQGYVTAFILRVDKTTGNVVQEMGNGRVDLKNYDSSNNGGGYFDVNFLFDKPIVFDLLSDSHDAYYIGFKAMGVDVNDLSFTKDDPLSTASYARLIKSGSTSGGNSLDDWGISTDTKIICHQLLVPTYTYNSHESTYSQDGFTYSSLTISQVDADVGQANPDFDAIQFVVPMEGFTDYEFGDQIYSTAEALKIFSYVFDGEQWSDNGAVDATTLFYSHYGPMYETIIGGGNISGQYRRGRLLSGIIEGKITYSSLLSELGSGTASKVGILSDGKLFMYPWGVTATPAFNVPQQDIIPLNYQVRPDSSIINRVQINAEKSYTVKAAFGDGEGYVIAIDYSSPDYIYVQEMTEQSRSIYGSKELDENTYDVFGFNSSSPYCGLPGYLTGGPSDSQVVSGGVVVYSVDFLADYYMSTYALPLTYVSFVVPFSRYSTIRMFDIVTFQHSEFPAFHGTEPNANYGVVDDGSVVTEVPHANFGEELVRAKTYRGIVEAVSYVLAMEHAPAIRLTVRVLLNQRFDPT
jgi:hypothetical protein